MKFTIYFYILVCMAISLFAACEKPALHDGNGAGDNSPQGEWIRLTPRTVDECEDCPVDYCCCAIELWAFTNEADISVCGFSNGDYLCGTYNPPGDCDDISGIGEDILLTYPDLTGVLVCKEESGAFRIFNNGGSTITIRMTCEYDLTSPTWTVITIPAHSEVFYATDGDCELSQCQ
jgi:hypothetical protein